MKLVSIAGSTGSIGTQAIEIILNDPGSFKVVALGANRSTEKLIEQARLLKPELLVVSDPEEYRKIKHLSLAGVEIATGPEGWKLLCEIAEIIVNAIVGFQGFYVSEPALSLGKVLALANKESLVVGGEFLTQKLKNGSNRAQIIPVDSEHSAIFQCLKGQQIYEVNKIILTSSGGPFRGYDLEKLESVSVDDALKHPTWKMGPKITIDSSTLMNKALEILEAHYLFEVEIDKIEVVIHPQSIIHSMVEFRDGSTLAQLSNPDMRLPISYALNYPARGNYQIGNLDFYRNIALEFFPPNKEVFKSLEMAYEVGKKKGAYPLYFNAANEVAVEAFLGNKITWLDIFKVIEKVMSKDIPSHTFSSIEEIIVEDRLARELAMGVIEEVA